MSKRPATAAVLLMLLLSACAPSVVTRPVEVPGDCDRVLQALAERGQEGFDERTAAYASFCQQQRLLRAEEEQAALARLQLEERTQHGWLGPLSLALGLLLVLTSN